VALRGSLEKKNRQVISEATSVIPLSFSHLVGESPNFQNDTRLFQSVRQ
jgi:hypothetical protein